MIPYCILSIWIDWCGTWHVLQCVLSPARPIRPAPRAIMRRSPPKNAHNINTEKPTNTQRTWRQFSFFFPFSNFWWCLVCAVFSLMPVAAWKDLQSSVNIIKVEMERPALSSAHWYIFFTFCLIDKLLTWKTLKSGTNCLKLPKNKPKHVFLLF